MQARKLDKSEWQSYFDRVSKQIGGRRVEIEVASLDIGDQIGVEWVPLKGMTYDPHDAQLEVFTEGLDHMIRNPREIYVEETAEGLATIEARDERDRTQIIRLKTPLLLSA